MGTGCRTRWLPTAAALVFGVVLGTAQARADSEGATLEPDAVLERSQRALGTTVGDYAFKAADGTPVRLAQFRGRPLLVSFVYTGCSQVCPTTTRFLAGAVAEADRALGPGRYAVATIGFNFPYDTPEAMRAFARQQGIDRRDWVFLSPEAGVVEGITRDLGFSYAASAGGFDHLTQVTLLDADGPRGHAGLRRELRRADAGGAAQGPPHRRAHSPAHGRERLRARAAAVHRLRPAHRPLPARLRRRGGDPRRHLDPRHDALRSSCASGLATAAACAAG